VRPHAPFALGDARVAGRFRRRLASPRKAVIVSRQNQMSAECDLGGTAPKRVRCAQEPRKLSLLGHLQH
jgi:hypothetical protein